MNKARMMQYIEANRIVAIIRLPDLSPARALAETLLAGGIRVMEFTLTNPQAFDVVRQLRQDISAFDAGEAVIGIGSIRSGEQAQRAVDSGAQLLVAPILLREMIAVGHQAAVVTAPAGFTPTEIDTAQSLGADIVKVFPADILDVKFITGIKAAMPDLRVMPTGGINLDNIQAYLRAGVTAVGVGSALINRRHVEAADWLHIQAVAEHFVAAVGATDEP